MIRRCNHAISWAGVTEPKWHHTGLAPLVVNAWYRPQDVRQTHRECHDTYAMWVERRVLQNNCTKELQ